MKRKLVRTFRTAGRRWRVYEAFAEDDRELERAYGYCEIPSGTIVLNADLDPEMKKITLAHEMVHAMFSSVNRDLFAALTQQAVKLARSDIEERLASFLSVPLSELLSSLK